MIHNPEVGREYRVLPNDAFVPVGATAVVVRIVEETGLPLCRVETAFGIRLVALTRDSIDELVGQPVTRQKLPRSRAVYGEDSPAGWRRPHSEDTKNRMRETWTPERRARQAEIMRERTGVVITAEQVEQCRALRRSGLAIKAIAAEMGVPKYRVLVMLEGADIWTRI